jgi:hypothetical protein
MDTDQSYKIQVIFELLQQGKIEEAKTAISQLGERAAGASKASEDLGRKLDDAGDHASLAAGKQQVLSSILAELNRLLPGSGHALHLVAEACIEAGTSAEAGVTGVEAFNTALGELLITLGPLIIVMLSIESASTCWDLYKDKANGAAGAVSEAFKKIDDSLRTTLKLQGELNEAMYGKDDPLKRIHEAAQQAGAERKARYENDREELRLREEKELVAARTPAEKESIKNKYAGKQEFSKSAEEGADIVGKPDGLEAVSKAKDLAKATADALLKQITELGVNGPSAERDRLNKLLEEQTKFIERLTGEQGELIPEIASGQSVAGIHAQGGRQETAIRVQGDNTIQSELDYANYMAGDHSQKTTDAIKTLTETYRTISGNVDLMLSAMKYAHDNSLTQKQEIVLIKQQLQALARNP